MVVVETDFHVSYNFQPYDERYMVIIYFLLIIYDFYSGMKLNEAGTIVETDVDASYRY